MEVCSRRRGLVTLGRIISSPESLAYWSGPDNINQLVKLRKIFLLVPANDESLERNPLTRIRREAQWFSGSRCGSNGQPRFSPDLTGGPR